FQRDFPLVERPFAKMAEETGVDEETILDRLKQLKETGRISRVGATVRPNTAGASTLAAMAVPRERIETVAAQVGAEPGVNHSYLREDEMNLWFVATAPDNEALEASLERIRATTGLLVLDLRLVRPFNIDLGFSLKGQHKSLMTRDAPDLTILQESDRPILHALSQGLKLDPRPFAQLGNDLGQSEADLIARIKTLAKAGILTRIGVIVRHRSVGWTSNAMVVWDIPEDRISEAGTALAQHPGITLCYQRLIVPGLWPYRLYSMIHARDRAEAETILDGARALPPLRSISHKALYSLRCFKQTGATLARTDGKAA
ncbi:MAG: Lrp/AsnC family transcriptional regulator, partial [Rhodobacteraceae bacterium]|nr:Lrp/AsnC family transcriptional regulator [Paracoccaceae bacterium]